MNPALAAFRVLSRRVVSVNKTLVNKTLFHSQRLQGPQSHRFPCFKRAILCENSEWPDTGLKIRDTSIDRFLVGSACSNLEKCGLDLAPDSVCLLCLFLNILTGHGHALSRKGSFFVPQVHIPKTSFKFQRSDAEHRCRRCRILRRGQKFPGYLVLNSYHHRARCRHPTSYPNNLAMEIIRRALLRCLPLEGWLSLSILTCARARRRP